MLERLRQYLPPLPAVFGHAIGSSTFVFAVGGGWGFTAARLTGERAAEFNDAVCGRDYSRALYVLHCHKYPSLYDVSGD